MFASPRQMTSSPVPGMPSPVPRLVCESLTWNLQAMCLKLPLLVPGIHAALKGPVRGGGAMPVAPPGCSIVDRTLSAAKLEQATARIPARRSTARVGMEHLRFCSARLGYARQRGRVNDDFALDGAAAGRLPAGPDDSPAARRCLMRLLLSLLLIPLLAGIAAGRVTTRVSVHSDGTEGPGDDGYPSITPDGRLVAFSGDSSLEPGGLEFNRSVFVHDRQTGETTVLSPADQFAEFAHISADGRFVSFLMFPPNASLSNVYEADRTTGVVSLVSPAPDGSAGSDYSYPGGISADGRFVSFYSDADNLIANDTNDEDDVFVADRVSGTVVRVSVASDGTESNGSSLYNDLSADGQVVAFLSGATNLVAGDTNGVPDVFVHDRTTGTTERVSVASDGTQANFSSSSPAISGDGRVVAFESYASNLAPGTTSGLPQIFVHERDTGLTTLVSVAAGGGAGDRYSRDPAISADGRFVGFSSGSTNLAGTDTNLAEDVYVYDRLTGTMHRASVDAAGADSANVLFDFETILGRPAVANGGMTAFMSPAPNLVADDQNGRLDVFVHDPTCGNSTADTGEECDDGNESDGDGCDRDCTVSLCTGGGTLDAVRVIVSHLDGVAGDDRLRLTGELALSPGTTFDPVTDGLQLRVADTGAPGSSLFDLSRLAAPIPPGSPGNGCGPRDGWQASGGGYSYRNVSGALDPPTCTPNSAPGRIRLKLRRLSDTQTMLTLKVDGATFAPPTGSLRPIVVLGATAAAGDAGRCGTTSLPAIACRSQAKGTGLTCRGA